MARTKGGSSTAITNWDEELAKAALQAAEMEANTGGGQFFSTKSGVLSWQDNPLPGNQMAVVILDTIMENVYYEGGYDPDTISSPICFAFGKEEKVLTPHKIVVENNSNQNDKCMGCPKNEWGSAEKGRGKACKNTRRLAMIPAGTINKQTDKFEMFGEDSFTNPHVGYMRLPVTSVGGYAGFVKQVAITLKRPPHGIVTRIRVVPDAKTQFRVLFDPLIILPNNIMGLVIAKHREVSQSMDFPYSIRDTEEVKTPISKPRKTTRRY